ncbi:hypothetical protein IKG60_01200 [Candidatus Saccharibacteria bacterium]|nr:hypothetical protein [Candidatus Saccharibacteria bacterium]
MVDVSISPTNINGTFSKSGASTISASTDNATGYTLNISAPSDAGSDYSKLINGSDNTAKLSSISSPTTESQFRALNGTAYNGMWGYLPSRYCSNSEDRTTCNDNTDFLPAPTISGDTIDITSTANTTANTYTLAIGARIDDSIKVGSYTNSFVVKLVGNAIPYAITYVDDTVGNMPIDIDTTNPTSEVTISSNIPTRKGHTFSGWCTVAPTINADGIDTCPSPAITIPAGGTITIDQVDTSQNSFTLHAMWTGNYTIGAFIASGATMQDFTYMDASKKGKIIASMTPETNYTLKDSRDNQDYTIALLRDGNVWMTKNLNIAGGTTLTCNQTDCDGGYVLPDNQGWQASGKLPESSTTGFDTDNYAYVYNSGNVNSGDTITCGGSGQNIPCYSYYSWDAATLGSGRTIAVQNYDAPYSICPKGWRLPTSGQDNGTTPLTNWKRGDFYRLLTAYGANLESDATQYTATFWNKAGAGTVANFLFSDYYVGSTFGSGGTVGLYWSSTSANSMYSRDLGFNTGRVYSASNHARRHGFSVRCMLR